ncbi:MAG TPA: ferritin-like domain-containing protein [Gammaproteobacteria bacterium]|nr:ferritin-like domain-containing protein [Gammaproteobacteria bacterium]
MEAVRDVARRWLNECVPERKVTGVHDLCADLRAGRLGMAGGAPPLPIGPPGRPPRPVLVPASEVPRRRLGGAEGRAALVHAIAHIEFNAINLALDAVHRFPGMPAEYYRDWLRVAADEARHFTLLASRLADLGYRYGSFPAHNGLWEMAEKTAHDVMIRMALVPRVLEARGLDVTPGMIERLTSVADHETVSVLRVILDEEVAHVAIGSHWFRHLCKRRGLAPEATFRELLAEYMSGRVRGPFNAPARLQAGFTAAELQALEALGSA